MKSRNSKDNVSRPINLVLLAVSFIIFGSLGIVFMTQMELQPAWVWEDIRDTYPIKIYSFETEDINGNGHREIISYADIRSFEESDYSSEAELNYGGIFCFEGKNGKIIWEKEFNGPVKKVFPIMDVDADGIRDYFVCNASIFNWTASEYNGEIHYEPNILPNSYTNSMISGNKDKNNTIILTGVGKSFTNNYVYDLVNLEVLPEHREDFIMLENAWTEITEYNNTWADYISFLTSYYVNGTKTNSIPLDIGEVRSESKIPAIELFHHNGVPYLVYIDAWFLRLFNLGISNFLEPVYNVTFSEPIYGYLIIKDLNSDDASEILVYKREGDVSLINGVNGEIIREFKILPEDLVTEEMYGDICLEEIHNEQDGITYILLNAKFNYQGGEEVEKYMQVYSIDLTSEENLWGEPKSGKDIEEDVFVLHEDLNGDSIYEIIHHEKYKPFLSTSDVRRYTIFNPINGEEYAILNTEFFADSIITISDFDGDNKKDFFISGDDRVVALSSRKPRGLWLSSAFPLGLPIFIVLVILLVGGVIIIVSQGKKLSYTRKNLKEHKLTITVNTIAIVLMTLTFLLFLIFMNIFNNTLIIGSSNSNIVLTFIIVTIIWYGALPLTAALYNKFAPQFAYIFVKLRDLFFKLSKGYKNDILVLDLRDKKDIGIIIQLKRVILPLLLAIAIGFYAYDILTWRFRFKTKFEVFGSNEFFSFMIGYMLCCLLPMILSFVVFAFLISGNYLLDDAGVVYYREHEKYRQPGDIEPISIWAQSIIKGIAGFSALLTFGNFMSTVDFSGFFELEGGIFATIFGILVIFVMFIGIPFFTGFSYILLAGEVMEICTEENVQKLYKIMEKKGYDITPHDVTNIYYSENNRQKRENSEDIIDTGTSSTN